MNYHIDTGLIYEKAGEDCECPLCEIRKKVEEQFLHEFLNDAVMEETTRAKVNAKGFCSRHFDMLFSRQNKLSVALQIGTRVDTLMNSLKELNSVGQAKKQADFIKKSSSTCIICDLTEESMVKYYKTIAQMFSKEKIFRGEFLKSKGFCLEHYSKLLQYSKEATFFTKDYIEALCSLQKKAIEEKKENLKFFCDKHDYRNRTKPLGSAESALPDMREALYGKKNN